MKYFDLTMLLIVLTLSAAMGVCQLYEASHSDACSILCGCGGGGDGCNCTVFETGRKACDCKNCGCQAGRCCK